MDIEVMVHDAMKEAIEAEGQRLLDEAFRMRIVVTDHASDALNYAYAAFRDYGERNIVDSTATVIDENIPALPAPKEATNG